MPKKKGWSTIIRNMRHGSRSADAKTAIAPDYERLDIWRGYASFVLLKWLRLLALQSRC
jgi:hypothetical protein